MSHPTERRSRPRFVKRASTRRWQSRTARRLQLAALRDDRQRAECMAAIQRDAVQLALDLLVTHPDLRGFFRMFIKRLVDDSESARLRRVAARRATRRQRPVDGEHRRRNADGRQRRTGRRSTFRARA